MDGHYCTGVALVGPREVSLRDMDSYSVFQLVSYRAALCSVSHSPANSGSIVNNAALPLRIASSSSIVVVSIAWIRTTFLLVHRFTSPSVSCTILLRESLSWHRSGFVWQSLGEFLWSIRVELLADLHRSWYRNSIFYVSRDSRGTFYLKFFC